MTWDWSVVPICCSLAFDFDELNTVHLFFSIKSTTDSTTIPATPRPATQTIHAWPVETFGSALASPPEPPPVRMKSPFAF